MVELNLHGNQHVSDEEQPLDEICEKSKCFFLEIQSRHTDIKVLSGTIEIPAHKAILSCRVPYIRDVLIHGAANKDTIDVPPEISPDAVRLVMDHAYFKQPKVTLQNAQALLEATAYFRVDDLWAFCDHFIAGRIKLTIENCLEVHGYAIFYCAKLLRTAACLFIAERLGDVVGSDAFRGMSQEEIVSLLSVEDTEFLLNEKNIWEALVEWIEADSETRKHLMPRLLGFVRLPCLNAHRLLQHPLIKNDNVCRRMVNDFLLYKANPNNAEIAQRCKATFKLEKRAKHPSQLCYFEDHMIGDRVQNRIQVLQSPDGVWIEKVWKILPDEDLTIMKAVSVTKSQFYLFTFDGEDRPGLFSYNSVTDTWAFMCDNKSDLDNFAYRPDLDRVEFCSVNGKLVAVSTSGSKVWVYDACTNSWALKRLKRPAERFSNICCGVTNGKDDNEMICCFYKTEENENGEGKSCRIRLYDVNTGNLMQCGRKLPASCFPTVAYIASYNGKVFVADHVVKVYDVSRDEWSSLPDLNVARWDFRLVVAYDRLYAIGGVDLETRRMSSAVEYVDLTKRTYRWRQGPELLERLPPSASRICWSAAFG